jgi:hypothetical protein
MQPSHPAKSPVSGGYALLEFLGLIALLLITFFPGHTKTQESVDIDLGSAYRSVALSEEVLFAQTGSYTSSYGELQQNSGLVAADDTCYGAIALRKHPETGIDGFSFEIGHSDRKRYPLAFSYDSVSDGSAATRTPNDFECVSFDDGTIRPAATQRAGAASGPRTAEAPRGVPEPTAPPAEDDPVKDMYDAIAASQEKFRANSGAYSNSYKDLVDSTGLGLDDSVCYGRLETLVNTQTNASGFRFMLRHADRAKSQTAYSYSSLGDPKVTEAKGEFDCVVGKQAAGGAAPAASPQASAPDGDARATAAYQAVAKAEDQHFYKNVAFSDIYSALVQPGYLKIDDDVCYGALELVQNQETYKQGFRVKVRYKTSGSTVYAYDSTLPEESRVSTPGGSLACVIGQ